FSVRYQRNPISFIKTRIKSPDSILKKLQSKGYEISLESIHYNLHDVAGIRVICSFIDDIYEVARMLTSQDDIILIETKDYIQNPKENGYRSLHLIVEVPVFMSDRKQPMQVEVQIRTIAMDFWASLDHQLRYKKDLENAEQISADLKECADIITATDQRMQIIKYQIYGDESGNFLN
ncbi:MAG: GTP pyrophosphokinase family protein, partial [Lachnospiraceae bacterium]|nr:GTP pyrophosphokinase family protein [Lachnospiraceae bacterium]